MFSRMDTVLDIMHNLTTSTITAWTRASVLSQELQDRLGYLAVKDEGINSVRNIGWCLSDLSRFLEMVNRGDIDSFLEDADRKVKKTLNEIEVNGLTPEDFELTFLEYELFVKVASSNLINELREKISNAEDLDESTPGAILVEETKAGSMVSKYLNAAAGSKPVIDFDKYAIQRLDTSSQLYLMSNDYEVFVDIWSTFDLGLMLDQIKNTDTVKEYLFDLEEFYDRVIESHDGDHSRAWGYVEQLASDRTTQLIGGNELRVCCVKFAGTNGIGVFVYVENNINNAPALLYFPMGYIEAVYERLQGS